MSRLLRVFLSLVFMSGQSGIAHAHLSDRSGLGNNATRYHYSESLEGDLKATQGDSSTLKMGRAVFYHEVESKVYEPYCIVNTVGRSDLVPSFAQAQQNENQDVFASWDESLPLCDTGQVAWLQETAGHLGLLSEVQLAGPMLALALIAGGCVASGLIGAFAFESVRYISRVERSAEVVLPFIIVGVPAGKATLSGAALAAMGASAGVAVVAKTVPLLCSVGGMVLAYLGS